MSLSGKVTALELMIAAHFTSSDSSKGIICEMKCCFIYKQLSFLKKISFNLKFKYIYFYNLLETFCFFLISLTTQELILPPQITLTL